MKKIPPQQPDITSNEEELLPKWISIARLIYQDKPIEIPVLAEAIDKHQVQTFDDTGRRILATDGNESDYLSKAWAKKHLSIRHNLNVDPIPDDELDAFHEKLQICGDPLDNFGWPKTDLPDFTKINPHVTPINHQSENNSDDAWTQRTLEEFEKEYKQAGSYKKAADIHGVSRQRYTEVIQAKRKRKSWNLGL